jgi:Ca2+-binding RTX toxin-like protein
MIEVRGTRAAPEANAGPRYDFSQDDKPSKTPWVLGLALVGLAAYLKSIFPSWANIQVEEPAEKPPGDDPEATLAQGKIGAPERPDLDPAPTGTVSMAGPLGSGGQLVSLVPPAKFSIIPSPEIDPMRLLIPETSMQMTVQAPFFVLPANDNGIAPSGGGGSYVPAPVDEDPGGDPGGQDPGDDNGEPTEENRAPRLSGPVYLGNVYGCTAALILLDSLLANAADPDGDPLTVRNLSGSSGALLVDANGWWFTPTGLGFVVLTYEIWDGIHSVTQTAHFSVMPNLPVYGTDGDDLLVGTECADQIDGRGGHDNIDARGGDDIVDGGDGDDHIVGGSGDDTLRGGDSDDVIFGGSGNDRISGGCGNDRLFGDEGDDTIFGDAGHDLIFGGSGDDLAMGGSGDDTIFGEAGNDTLLGEDGCDLLDGGEGDDVLDGGNGDDELVGGEGNDVLLDGRGADRVDGSEGDDTVMAAADCADDHYEGGAGDDTLDYSVATSAIVVDLRAKTASGIEIGNDTISGFENIIGGMGGDRFVVGSAPVSLSGRGGNDVFEFSAASGGTAASAVVHEILDYMVGDRIRIDRYDLFEEVLDTVEDRLEDMFGEDAGDELPIRIRHQQTDDRRSTIVEADFDKDDNFELSIELTGHHLLMVVEYA